MEFVVNEWLMEYLRPEASDDERKLARRFLQRFMQRPDDKIFVRKPSAFLSKALRYAKLYQNNTETVKLYRNFIKDILLNQEKCYLVNEEMIPLNNDIVEKLHQPNTNFNSDTYLFEAATFTKDKVIVTTDERLAYQMQEVSEINVILLTEFLKMY